MAIQKIQNSTAHDPANAKKQAFKNDGVTTEVGIIITDLLGDVSGDGADSVLRARGKNVFIEFRKGLQVSAITWQPPLQGKTRDVFPMDRVRLRMELDSLFVLVYPTADDRRADSGKKPFTPPPAGTTITEYQFGASGDALWANCATEQNGFAADPSELSIFY